VGTRADNQDLSYRRATPPGRYLHSQGVTRRIGTRGLAEDEPVASNDTDSGRRKNRRVEVAIYASEAWQAEAKRQASAP